MVPRIEKAFIVEVLGFMIDREDCRAGVGKKPPDR